MYTDYNSIAWSDSLSSCDRCTYLVSGFLINNLCQTMSVQLCRKCRYMWPPTLSRTGTSCIALPLTCDCLPARWCNSSRRLDLYNGIFLLPFCRGTARWLPAAVAVPAISAFARLTPLSRQTLSVWAQVARASDRPSLFVRREMEFSAADGQHDWRRSGFTRIEMTAAVTQSF